MRTKNLKKTSQIWVETAIYTLIGLTIIAIILSAAIPQIEKIKDKSVLRQTIEALGVFDEKIQETAESSGEIRVINIKIAQGKLEINSTDNKIRYIMENTRYQASEIGAKINEGNNMVLETSKYGARYKIIVTMDYNALANITYNKNEITKTLTAGSLPYTIYIQNLGYDQTARLTNINLNV